jgi:hypothetical protein
MFDQFGKYSNFEPGNAENQVHRSPSCPSFGYLTCHVIRVLYCSVNVHFKAAIFYWQPTQHITQLITLSVKFIYLHFYHLCLSVPIVCCLYFLDVLIVIYLSVLLFRALITKVQFFFCWRKLVTHHKLVIPPPTNMQMKTKKVVVSMEHTR